MRYFAANNCLINLSHRMRKLTCLVLQILATLSFSCSIEKESDSSSHSPFSLDPTKYIVPLLVTEQSATKGMPIDEVADMQDFGFFGSYTNTVPWSAAANPCNKMYNQKMVRDNVTHPTLVLWQYSGSPVPWSAETAASMYTFFAYAPYATGAGTGGNGVTITSTSSSVGIPTLTYEVPLTVENQPDLMFADPVYDLLPTGHPVPLQMRHALTAVGFRVAGLTEKIVSLSVTGIYVSGNAAINGNSGAITWNLTGNKTLLDYSASLNYDPGQNYYSVTPSFTNPLKHNGWLMMLPQALTSDAKVKITLQDGTTREVFLMTHPTDEWEAGKREVYNIFVTPAGATSLFPAQTDLSYKAHTPAPQPLSVVCLDYGGNPDPLQSWTLTVPSSAPWLTISLNPDGTGTGTTLTSTGSQTVYLYASSNLGPSAVVRSADLSLDNFATVAATVTQGVYPDSKWVYVMEGATGSGSSWNDAVGTITEAMATSALLRGAGYTVHGVLVAGGAERRYNESVTITTDKIYGGWEGLWGTELPNNPAAPYTSPFRNLEKHKAILTGSVSVSGANASFDGAIIEGGSNVSCTVTGGAYINAIEIRNNTASGNIVNLQGAGVVASNLLVVNNTGNITVASGATLLNATIIQNTGGLICSGASMYNTIEWGNSVAFSDLSSIAIGCCAFANGSAPAPSPPPPPPATKFNNIELHSTNTEWFSSSNVVPGPHFNLSEQTGNPYYAALNDRAPMLGRGNQALFTTHTPFFPAGYETDIMGNPRHYQGTDIGCYEDGAYKGFQLRWASDRIYVSSNNGYLTDAPLLIPDNATIGAEVAWTVTKAGVLNYCDFAVTPPVTGSGTGVMVGTVQFVTVGDHFVNSERKCGEIWVQTNLGGYLPNQIIEVWQTAGLSAPWTQGYVGSFHRNNERGARYISGANSGSWTVRIISGLDWIKIDANPKNYGIDILSEPHPGGVPGYKKEVEEVFGGVITGTGNITFRVGMKSNNPNPAQPRYGLIIIQRSGGVAWFYVRQGEADDYLYRPTDPRVVGGVTLNRNQAAKFSPFSVWDSQYGSGRDLGYQGGAFTHYPTQFGYFFQWNRTTGYRFGGGVYIPSGSGEASFNYNREVCPPGYRQGKLDEWLETLYWRAVLATSGSDIGKVAPGDLEGRLNFLEGCYADGFYDALAPDPAPPASDASAILGTLHEQAFRGILMVNHYNYGAIFFPTISCIAAGSASLAQIGYSRNFMADLRTLNNVTEPNTAHWSNNHIGTNCYNSTPTNVATPVRCILGTWPMAF